jgi:hypothetical protein
MGIYGAYTQNQRIQGVMDANAASAATEFAQIDSAASLETQKRHLDVHRARSRLKVLAADSGLDFGGGFAELDQQAAASEQINDAITQENAYMTKQRIASQLRASFLGDQSKGLNPVFTGLSGALSGIGTGLQIGGGLDKVRDAHRQSASEANAAAAGVYSGMGDEIPEPTNMTVIT